MDALSRQRCRNHPAREAAALCPACSRYFCRECVTEHEDRVLCAPCLKKALETAPGRKFRLRWITGPLLCAFGSFVIWAFFYYTGQVLLSLPSSFHEGTVWERLWEMP